MRIQQTLWVEGRQGVQLLDCHVILMVLGIRFLPNQDVVHGPNLLKL